MEHTPMGCGSDLFAILEIFKTDSKSNIQQGWTQTVEHTFFDSQSSAQEARDIPFFTIKWFFFGAATHRNRPPVLAQWA